MVVLVVRGLLRRPSLSDSPTVTFCSVHIHNVVAKKRDASTDLLRRLHAHMLQHNVDFIGSDFNMSAFSTVGDVFCRQSFRFRATLSSGSLVLWKIRTASAPGFLIMPKRPYQWRVDSHGCFKFNNADLALGPRDTTAHLPVFLHLRTTNCVTRSDQARQRRLERKASKHEHRQCRGRLTPSNVRVHHLTPSVVTSEFCVGEGDAARRDHTSSHVLTRSATSSQFWGASVN